MLVYSLETGDAIVISLGGGESVTVRMLDIKGVDRSAGTLACASCL
ncbi:MAG: hypothetical protein KDB22_12925 [Planctomycetales bacterium]|nr:hypothetical protein [Planctomycetales bacterium]